MAPYLFWEFVILIIGVWLMAVLFFVYGWLLLKRQKQMILMLLGEKVSEKKTQTEPEPVHLEISKNEPIAKYKDMSPDEATVSFVEEDK